MQHFVDGFDNYNSITSIWENVTGSPIMGNSTPNTRFSNPTGCVSQWVNLTGTKSAMKNLLSSQTSFIGGAAFYLTQLSSIAATLMGFTDTGTNQVGITVNNAGSLQFIRGGGGDGTLIGTATASATIAINTWYALAIVVTIGSGTAGSVTAYLNGTQVINSSGLNTQVSGNNTANQFYIGNRGSAAGTGFGNTNCWDDVFVWDTNGSTQNAWPGSDVRVLTKLPTSAGFYTNWTPTNPTNVNWSNVANNPPNDTEFNSNGTPSTKDSYSTTPTNLGLTPYSVTTRQYIYKNDGSTHTASSLVRSNGTDGTGSAFTVNSSKTFVDTVFVNDPNTSAPWTASSADNTQIGVVEVS